jgi:hypothetical protein
MTEIAHVGGLPIEETLGMYGPALLLAAGAASASLKARLRRLGGGRGGDRLLRSPARDRAARAAARMPSPPARSETASSGTTLSGRPI